MASTLAEPSARPSTAHAPSGFIPEIEGIRGLALTLVVLFHVFGNGRVSGGVDVFLFITGYLLTRSLVARAGQQRIELRRQYARSLSRLVPAAAVVLAAVGIGAWLFAPRTQWIQTAHEIMASALYYENWELIESQLAYGAAGPSTSPLQHFWSLSVQGQFLLIWPLVVVGIAMVTRSRAVALRRVVLWVAIAVSIMSFGYAVWLGAFDQQVAYLSSFTRAWEISAGAVAAIAMGRLSIPHRWKAILGWIGLLMIVSCGFLIDGASSFPGPLALWPIVGVLLMVIGSGAAGRATTGHLLLTRPVLAIAGMSYALYLWHWPVLVFYIQSQHQTRVGWRGAIVVLAISLALAWATQRFIVNPLIGDAQRTRGGARLIAMATIALMIAGAAWSAAALLERERDSNLALAAQSGPDHPGAIAGVGASTEWEVPFVPAPDAAEKDLPAVYSEGCVQNYRGDVKYDAVEICEPYGPADATKTIVMSGGSHVIQWLPALAEIADQEGWHIIVVDKDGCRLSDPDLDEGLGRSCSVWNRAALTTIESLEPDAVFTVATRTPEDDTGETFNPAQADRWLQLVDLGIPVVAIRDTPRFTVDIPTCISRSEHLEACARARNEIFAKRTPVDPAVLDNEMVALPDLTDQFCTSSSCGPIVGNVLIYRDRDHMTATYARTLAPALRAALAASAPWLFD
ncbi:MAG TPA: acyltransferase family protein [Microbacterium sp.]|uniref:acyltransferase family protein n=1 Tax=Microbacterium sp. TaxID=51671 RepID=UPI002F944203